MNSWGTYIYQFVNNNSTLLYFLWMKKLPNHTKVSKYYEHDSLENFLLLFMSLLTLLIVKKVIFWLDFISFFWKSNLDQTLKAFNTEFRPNIRQTCTKHFIQTLTFMWNSASQEKFNSWFSRILLLLAKFSFGE